MRLRSNNHLIANTLDDDHPVANGNNTTSTYRSHYLRDREAQVVEGASDWHVTNKLGRWRLRVKDALSNKVEFKVDKRSQIVGAALDWANYWPDRAEETKVYGELGDGEGGTETFLQEQRYRSLLNGAELFTQCHSFAGYLYNRHGLYGGYNNDVECGTLQADATAEDNGLAAIRAFGTHSGIITGFGALYGGQMADINNPGEPVGSKGVKLHDWNLTGPNDSLVTPRPNRTVPDPSGAVDPATLYPKSFLKTLGEE